MRETAQVLGQTCWNRIEFLWIFFVLFWGVGVHPSVLRLTPGRIQETVPGTRYQIQDGCMQGKCLLHCTISSTPGLHFWTNFRGNNTHAILRNKKHWETTDWPWALFGWEYGVVTSTMSSWNLFWTFAPFWSAFFFFECAFQSMHVCFIVKSACMSSGNLAKWTSTHLHFKLGWRWKLEKVCHKLRWF